MEKIRQAFTKFIHWQYCGLFLIVLFSLFMHLSVITQPSDGYIFDETYYIKDAHNIIDSHTTDRPEHPPLAKLIIVAGIETFGITQWLETAAHTFRHSQPDTALSYMPGTETAGKSSANSYVSAGAGEP
jgi:hypothetical protein